MASQGPLASSALTCLSINSQDFLGGPVVKNLPCNAGDAGSIPGRGTKIPHAMGQLSPHAAAREKPVHHNEEPTRCNEKSRMP